ncbi:MAG TPA: Lrp/AsnC family transcriptional regulator [Conexibacter sp.]|nr:Lrp/AsnC family transcriptional regulator [Conexibacter sp.]
MSTSVISTALDDVDRVILSELIRNGRASFKELGELAGLSPHAVAPRVRRLVDAGIVTGFTALVDYGHVGRSLDALIDLRLLSNAKPEAFEQAAGELPSIREVSFVTGRFDYQLRAACVDADDLDHTVRALRQAGAAVTETRIVLRTQPFLRPVR